MTGANQTEIMPELQQVRELIAKLTAELSEAQGRHDLLLVCLLDTEGASDQRPVAVR